MCAVSCACTALDELGHGISPLPLGPHVQLCGRAAVQLTASRLIVIDSDPVRARETSSSGWRQTVGGRKEGGKCVVVSLACTRASEEHQRLRTSGAWQEAGRTDEVHLGAGASVQQQSPGRHGVAVQDIELRVAQIRAAVVVVEQHRANSLHLSGHFDIRLSAREVHHARARVRRVEELAHVGEGKRLAWRRDGAHSRRRLECGGGDGGCAARFLASKGKRLEPGRRGREQSRLARSRRVRFGSMCLGEWCSYRVHEDGSAPWSSGACEWVGAGVQGGSGLCRTWRREPGSRAAATQEPLRYQGIETFDLLRI
ncbi:hypothetical protein T492DRAFT_839888 [Pavlovales sp. CCMP2436]|nr:hypothetical protein T492DRAFT_839888 [Pavlovales sp. CCMP2436]